MLQFEWKKLLYYRKGLLLIVVFLVAELLGTILFTKPYDKDLEANRAAYDRYLSMVEGPLTPENRQWLEDEMLRLNTANTKLEQLKSDYYQGRITEEAFRSSFDILAAENADYPGFSKLYAQYIYVRESDQRQFLYTGGWEVLFGDQDPDYLFLLLLIFLIAPIFCQEYGNQMDQILLTQKRSAKYQWRTKVTVALLATAVLTGILQLFELTYCAIQFGLPHWEYSLQSLYSFGFAQKELTLGQAFFLQFALKEIGYLYVALLILCISVLVKKYVFALMASMVILPIPFLTVNSHASLCLIPGPWALTIGTIYLNGEGNRFSGSTVISMQEISWNVLGKVVAGSLLICFFLLLCIRYKNTNYHLRSRKRQTGAALLATLFLCAGCGNQTGEIRYNSRQSNCFESARYILFADGMDGCYFMDQQTDMIHDFPLDAFQGKTALVKDSFYAENGKLYYLKAQQQALTGSAEALMEFFALVELDMDTMQERLVYQWQQDTRWFFGLLKLDSTEPIPYLVNSFFIHGGDMFYESNGELYAMDLQTGQYESYMTLPNSSGNLAYDGENIYYTDQFNRLSIHNLETGETEALESVVARDFILAPEGIYFINIRDGNTLYFWNKAAKAAQKLDDTESYAIYWDECYCWVNTVEGLYRMNHDGTEKTAVDCPGIVCCIPQGSVFFTMDHENEILYSVEKDTLIHTKLVQ